MQRLLYIGHVWPEPRSSAAGERTLALLRVFAQAGWHTTFASAATRGERSEGLENVAAETASIALNDDRFDRFVVDCRPDIVVFDRFMIEEQFGWRVENHCPSALRILDTVDLHCLRLARQFAASHGGEIDEHLLAGDSAKREIAAIWRSDLSLLMSQYEYELVQRSFSVPSELLYRLPFMIERQTRGERTVAFADRSHFATIGNFLHAPNRDSFKWLQREIWPLIRRRLPTAQLQVYGAYLPQSALDKDDPSSGFRVRGWAPHARDALGRVRVSLAPLRFGAGLKGKIVDAMAAGTPTVTTLIGAESMGPRADDGSNSPGWCGAICDDAESIADAAVELHENEPTWLRAQQSGFDILASEFDAAVLGRAFLERTQHCIARLDQRRRENFTGAMLRHHRHRSTEYMARWIQAKKDNPRD